MVRQVLVGGRKGPFQVAEQRRQKVVNGAVVLKGGVPEEESEGFVLVLPGFAGVFSKVGLRPDIESLADDINEKIWLALEQGRGIPRILAPIYQSLPDADKNKFSEAFLWETRKHILTIDLETLEDDTAPQQPSGDLQQPRGELQQPSGEPQQPSGEPQQPGGEPQQPGGEPQQPGGQSQQKSRNGFKRRGPGGS